MKYIVLLLSMIASTSTYSQTKDNAGFTPGDIVPDLMFKTLLNYHSTEASLSDFEDKLIILDFWATWCGPCIQSMKKLHDLQEKYSDRIQVITVTRQDEHIIKPFLQKKGFFLPTVVADSMLNNIFPHKAIPHQVWIKDGKVTAIPPTHYTTAENIEKALRGEKVGVIIKRGQTINRKEPLLSAVGDLETLYYSAITKTTGNQASGRSSNDNSLLAYNQSMVDLFITAYKLPRVPYHGRVIYEINDSLRSVIAGPGFPKLGDNNEKIDDFYKWRADNTYCYNLYFNENTSLIESKGLISAMYAIMSQDLNRYFTLKIGVIGKVEKRSIKCLVLVKFKKANNKKSIRTDTLSNESYILENRYLKSLISDLAIIHYKDIGMPIVDDSGIEERMDLRIEGGIHDLNNVKAKLRKYGLALEERIYPLDMLVFRKVAD